MANMSYCRFQNTLGDLRECYTALGEIYGLPEEELSKDEFRAFEELVKVCKNIADEFGEDE